MNKTVQIIDNFFKKKLYTIEDIKQFVQKQKITKEEYKQITGQDYID